MSREASAKVKRPAAGASALRKHINELVTWVTTGGAQPVHDLSSVAKAPAGVLETSKDALARKALVSEFISAVKVIPPRASRQEMFQIVADRLAQGVANACKSDSAPPVDKSVSAGWQDLLADSLKYKSELLSSQAFRSVTEAGAQLKLSDDVIRRRILSKRILALASPRGEFRIPFWALDSGIAGANTSRLFRAAMSGPMDDWDLYLFMTTPHGILNGMIPFEVLLSSKTLRQKADLEEWLEVEDLPRTTEPIDLVCGELLADRRA